ncbi:hypothetical protein [Microvirga roseola]|nr:hypothetical protein [Microvirga roseola]
MADGFHLGSGTGPSEDDTPPRQRMPLVPALIGTLAVANVTSVFLALMQ